MTDVNEPVFTRGFALLSILAFGALSVLIILGSWQVKRLFWKEALIETVNERVQAPAKPFNALQSKFTGKVQSDREAFEYHPVTVRGTFDHTKEMFYFATLDGVTGFHVYAPLKITESDETVLVNRGFVPTEQKDYVTRPNSRLVGEVEINGLVRFPDKEKPNWFLPDNDTKQNIFFWRDIGEMMRMANLDPTKTASVFVYADRVENNRLPIGGVTILAFANNHLGYAATWYGLALTLIGVYIALFWSRFKATAQNQTQA